MVIHGCILIVIGYLWRCWCVYILKENFTLSIQKPTKIIRKGPYKILKHPAYVGSVVMFFGFLLIDVRIPIMLLSILFFVDRAQRENKILSEMENKK